MPRSPRNGNRDGDSKDNDHSTNDNTSTNGNTGSFTPQTQQQNTQLTNNQQISTQDKQQTINLMFEDKPDNTPDMRTNTNHKNTQNRSSTHNTQQQAAIIPNNTGHDDATTNVEGTDNEDVGSMNTNDNDTNSGNNNNPTEENDIDLENNNNTPDSSQEESDITLSVTPQPVMVKDADKPYFAHWLQREWTIVENFKFIIQSERIKRPCYKYPYLLMIKYMMTDPDFWDILKRIKERDRDVINFRCAQLFRDTKYALYKLSNDEDFYVQIFPDDDEEYYTNLLNKLGFNEIRGIMKLKASLLGELMGKQSECNTHFSDLLRLNNISVNNTDENKEDGTQPQGTEDVNDIQMGTTGTGNQGAGGTRGNQNQSHVRSNLENVSDPENGSNTRPGNVNDTSNDNRGDRACRDPRPGDETESQFEQAIRNSLESLHAEYLARFKRDINQINSNSGNTGDSNGLTSTAEGLSLLGSDTNDNNNNNTNNNNSTINVSNKAIQTEIGKQVYKSIFTIDFKFNHNYNTTPGNILKYKIKVSRWNEKVKSLLDDNYTRETNQVLLTRALYDSLAIGTREIFVRDQVPRDTVDVWLKRFNELWDVDEDFKAHSRMLKNYISSKDVDVEHYIPAFLEVFKINQIAREHVSKVPNINQYILRDNQAIYDAAVNNMNPVIISEVTKYFKDHWNTIDWTWAIDHIPDFPIPPPKDYDLLNVHMLHTGIINLARYIRSVQSTEPDNTPHINDSILTYKLLSNKTSAKRHKGDGTTNIGESINAMEMPFKDKQWDHGKYDRGYQGKQYGSRKQRPGFRKTKKINKFKNQRTGLGIGCIKKFMKKVGYVYIIKPNTEASRKLEGRKIETFIAKKGKKCRIDGLQHPTQWHFYLKDVIPNGISKVQNAYKQRMQRLQSINAINNGRQGRGKHGKNKNKPGKGKNKTKPGKGKGSNKSGKTNTVGAIAEDSDVSQRGGIISSNNTNETKDIFAEQQHRQNILNTLNTLRSDSNAINKAMAGANTNAPSFTTAKHERSNTKS